MTCPGCGHGNREGARFCERCGARVDAAPCPRCGNAVRPGSRFCDACGATLTVEPAAARAPASYTPRHLAERILTAGRSLRGERKEVTVVFVDVQGSTELSGTLDPEEFHQVMDGAFELMLDAVHRWEGTVNQFTGDGIMALFGAPLAHEDHARRALAASLEIQRGFVDYGNRLRRDRGLSIQVRLGLNSGPVVVGAIGDDLRMDYTAQGLTTNLAARMQQAADPGTILVADATYRLTEGYFQFRALGPMRLRGIPEPVETYALEREGTVVSRLEASLRRGISPFKGREAELRAIGESWQRALAGSGEALCLVGEPGIGKSRLAYEFHRTAGLTSRVEAAGLAHARGAAYFVFRQLLRALAGIPADEDLAASRDVLHRRLWDLEPGLVEHAPYILSILGTSCETPVEKIAATSEERSDRVRDAVVQWVRAECRRIPCVLVVEDLQWLDPSSEDLLGHLAREARALPLLLLLTSRLPLGGTRLEVSRIRELPLRALSTEDVGTLVDAQLEPYGAGERVRRIVTTRSEGNPFFVEELVRAFREQGQLALDHGVYDLRAGAEALVPATISALIASRIDRLPPSARELLGDAAVLGIRFPLSHLRALRESERFDEDLGLVERRGLLDRHSESAMTVVEFRHVLTHDVVYGGLLQTDRQTRHHRAADMLERLYRGRTEEVCDVIAHHWAHSDVRVQAFPHFVMAADGALALGARREAIGHLTAALALADDHEETIPNAQRAALRLKLAGLHFMVDER